VRDDVARTLRAKSPAERASAATAARMLRDRELAEPVRAALLREHDPEAARRLCEAALALAVQLPGEALQPWLDDPETAPEAAALAAANAGDHAPEALRVALRRMLAPGRLTRVRVGAALALGRLRDERALPPLAAALDDPAARVRLAAVHALLAIGSGEALNALLIQTRVERDPLVREAALSVNAEPVVSPALVLEARVRTEASPAHERPLLDVLLDDGRWLRMRTLPEGELLLEDLHVGNADVRAVP
jgi:HEAT repeat protein